MNTQNHIKNIHEVFNKARLSLKPIGFILIFWGIYVNILSFIHFMFPYFIEQTEFSSLIYWIGFYVLGLIYTINWAIKRRINQGFTSILGRVIKIIWTVYFLCWIMIIVASYLLRINLFPGILFLLGIVIVMTGMIIRFKPLTIGGFSVFVFVFYILNDPFHNFLVINMASVTIAVLIPGIMLNKMNVNE